MNFMVELLRIGQLKFVLHRRFMSNAHEIVVPAALCRYHEETEELVRQQHLHALIMTWQIAFWIVAFVGVLRSPFKARRRQFIRSQ